MGITRMVWCSFSWEGKRIKNLYALLHKGRKLPLNSRTVRKGPKEPPGSDTSTPVPEKESKREVRTPPCTLRRATPWEECKTGSLENGEEGRITWPQMRFPNIRITFAHHQTGTNFIQVRCGQIIAFLLN